MTGGDVNYAHYPDEGCPAAVRILVHPLKCLECPFDECIEVIYEGKRGRNLSTITRAVQIRMRLERGDKLSAIAKEFNVSYRTVERVRNAKT